MKINYNTLFIGIIIGAAIVLFMNKSQVKEVKVPFTVEVEVPVVEKVFDTVYAVKEVKKEVVVKDEELINEYKKANDSLKKALFESAVTVRDYKEVFEDSTITITVGAKVTGTLNSLIAEYKTKPKVVVVDTTLSVDVPDYSRSIGVYGELGMPTVQGVKSPPVFKVGFDVTNKNNWVWGGSYDTEKRVWIKLGKKFNF